MCKILILQQHNAAERDALIRKLWLYFSASGETDGFGAMWLSKRKKLAWWKSSSPNLDVFDLPDWAEAFGSRSESASEPSDGGWLMIHGRKATCGINVENTHPMLGDDGESALIHNGVVDSDTVANITTTCDSELLLRAWLQAEEKGLEYISGYFAFGMLLRRGKTWDAIIARDDSARLRYGTTNLGHAWCTTDEGLKMAGAQPICDHKRNCGLVFSGNDPRPRSFKIKKAEKVTQSMQSDWLVANGESRVNYGKRVFTGNHTYLNR